MVRHEDAVVDGDAVDPLGTAEDAHDYGVELGAGSQQEAALESSGGDFDDGAFRGNETQSSRHLSLEDGKSAAVLAEKRVEPVSPRALPDSQA